MKYSDVNQFYNGKDENNEILYNIDDIYQSIQNILTTPKGTRAFLPEFGCNIEDYLFDLHIDETREAILTEIFDALAKWEPRIKMIYNLSNVTPIDLDEHIFKVEVVFEILGLDTNTYTFAYYLSPKNKGNL